MLSLLLFLVIPVSAADLQNRRCWRTISLHMSLGDGQAGEKAVAGSLRLSSSECERLSYGRTDSTKPCWRQR